MAAIRWWSALSKEERPAFTVAHPDVALKAAYRDGYRDADRIAAARINAWLQDSDQ